MQQLLKKFDVFDDDQKKEFNQLNSKLLNIDSKIKTIGKKRADNKKGADDLVS